MERKPVQKLLRALAHQLDIARYLWLFLFGLLYLLFVAAIGFRPFWFDEIYTYNLTTLPGFSAIWPAISHGADSNPVLFHYITRIAAKIFGPTEFGLRAPAVAGFLVMCVCLYAFVSRRAGTSYGFAALFLPWLTGAFAYAAEARPYGLMLGFCGLALVSWQRAAEGRRRVLYLACMAAALTAAILCHVYSVMLLVPFGIAQLIRDVRSRKFDWTGWAFTVAPLAGSITYLPMIHAMHAALVNNSIFRPTWHSYPDFWDFLLKPALWPLLGGALFVAWRAARRPVDSSGPTATFTTEEIGLACGFLIVPLLEIFSAGIATRVFMPRYGVAAVIGVTILLMGGAARVAAKDAAVGAALTLVFLGWALGWRIEKIAAAGDLPPAEEVALDQRPDLPLVISSGLLFYKMDHYVTPQMAARMWFVYDEPLAAKMTGSNVMDLGIPWIAQMFPIRSHLENYHRFLKTHPHFMMYGLEAHDLDWLRPKLAEDGARLTYVGRRGEEFGPAALFEVQMPEPTETSAR